MMMTSTQALAGVESLSKGAPKHFFEAMLGYGRCPTVDDFTASDAEKLEKCDEFVEFLQSLVDTLTDEIRNRPRQTALIPSADGSTLETKGATATKKTSAKKTPSEESANDRKNRMARERRAAKKKGKKS